MGSQDQSLVKYRLYMCISSLQLRPYHAYPCELRVNSSLSLDLIVVRRMRTDISEQSNGVTVGVRHPGSSPRDRLHVTTDPAARTRSPKHHADTRDCHQTITRCQVPWYSTVLVGILEATAKPSFVRAFQASEPCPAAAPAPRSVVCMTPRRTSLRPQKATAVVGT